MKHIVEKNPKDFRFFEGKIESLKLDLCDLRGCVSAAKEFLDREER